MAKIIKKEHSGVSRAPTSGGSRVIKAEATGARSAVIKADAVTAEGPGSKIIKAQAAALPGEGDTDVARAAAAAADDAPGLEDTEALGLPDDGAEDAGDSLADDVADAGDDAVGDGAADDGSAATPDALAGFEDDDALGATDAAGDPAGLAGAPAEDVAAGADLAGALGDDLDALDAEAEASARLLDAAVAGDDVAADAPVDLVELAASADDGGGDGDAGGVDPFAEPASTEALPLPREGSAIHRDVLPREQSAVHRDVLPRENSALHASPFAEPEPAPGLPREQSAIRRRTSVRSDEEVEGVARAIVARAQNEARALHEAVEQEIAQALAEAERRGHQEGLARTAQLGEKVQHLAEGLVKEVEPQAVEAAIAVARQLVAAELKAHPESVVALVRQALMSARQQRDVYVRVHPVHAETLRAHKREVVDVLGRAKDIDVREDPDLEPGGCMVETEIGTIDARLETQFEALVRHLTTGAR